MATFHFALISPERTAFDGEVNSVSLRSAGGDIGFLAGHVPYIGAVRISDCEVVRDNGSIVHLAVYGGFVEVDPDGRVTVLADIVETAEEIHVAQAQADLDAAAPRAGSAEPGTEAEAEAALLWAQVR
ncbi:MAG: ATP synthase F1 subunit epsilon, partial [Acidimicrobiaceae bacterium]|nr:ATP synthase F1 subunit epsilon [Acidimicrobiaceae bacterium]